MEHFVIHFGIDQREGVIKIIENLTKEGVIISYAIDRDVDKDVHADMDKYSILFKDKWGIYFFGWNQGGMTYQSLVSKELKQMNY